MRARALASLSRKERRAGSLTSTSNTATPPPPTTSVSNSETLSNSLSGSTTSSGSGASGTATSISPSSLTSVTSGPAGSSSLTTPSTSPSPTMPSTITSPSQTVSPSLSDTRSTSPTRNRSEPSSGTSSGSLTPTTPTTTSSSSSSTSSSSSDSSSPPTSSTPVTTSSSTTSSSNAITTPATTSSSSSTSSSSIPQTSSPATASHTLAASNSITLSSPNTVTSAPFNASASITPPPTTVGGGSSIITSFITVNGTTSAFATIVPSGYSGSRPTSSKLSTGTLVGISVGIVGVVAALLGLGLLMRRRLIKRKRFAEALGLTDHHRPPMLDGELDDGNEGPVYNPYSYGVVGSDVGSRTNLGRGPSGSIFTEEFRDNDGQSRELLFDAAAAAGSRHKHQVSSVSSAGAPETQGLLKHADGAGLGTGSARASLGRGSPGSAGHFTDDVLNSLDSRILSVAGSRDRVDEQGRIPDRERGDSGARFSRTTTMTNLSIASEYPPTPSSKALLLVDDSVPGPLRSPEEPPKSPTPPPPPMSPRPVGKSEFTLKTVNPD